MPSPLTGLNILDFTTLLPGPYATQLLADMGARVLKVESPTRPDSVRFLQPQVAADTSDTASDKKESLSRSGPHSAAHATLNRNKQSIALDLKQDPAQAIIHRLIADYDIVIEQFRPGVMQRLKLDYASLAAVNPRLIYCSISGYGQTGPLRQRAGHDINYLALSGLASFSGTRETGPVLSGTQIADIAGGSHHAVMAILAAVIQRQSTGKGQYIDISMSDASLALTTLFGANYLASDISPGYGTEILNGGSFYGYYETLDGRYFSVGSLEPQFLQRLLTAIGHPEWFERAQDPHPQSQTQLVQDIRAVIATKTFAEWKNCFARYDACVEPVLTLDEVRGHPQFQEREMFVEVPNGIASSLTQIASPLKFSASAPEYRHSGPALGADTEDVLRKYGFNETEIAKLRDADIIL